MLDDLIVKGMMALAGLGASAALIAPFRYGKADRDTFHRVAAVYTWAVPAVTFAAFALGSAYNVGATDERLSLMVAGTISASSTLPAPVQAIGFLTGATMIAAAYLYVGALHLYSFLVLDAWGAGERSSDPLPLDRDVKGEDHKDKD